jgi:hypothetical protein
MRIGMFLERSRSRFCYIHAGDVARFARHLGWHHRNEADRRTARREKSHAGVSLLPPRRHCASTEAHRAWGTRSTSRSMSGGAVKASNTRSICSGLAIDELCTRRMAQRPTCCDTFSPDTGLASTPGNASVQRRFREGEGILAISAAKLRDQMARLSRNCGDEPHCPSQETTPLVLLRWPNKLEPLSGSPCFAQNAGMANFRVMPTIHPLQSARTPSG